MRSLGKKLDAYNGEGTVFGSINGKALKGIGIGLPGNDDIATFEAMVAPIDAQIRLNETESRILSQLRDALLPKLMSGEIDVSKVDITQLNSHLSDHSVAIREINNSTIAETIFINRFIALRMLFEKLSHGIRHAFDILG